MDAVVGGETFVVTRNGEPVAELRPRGKQRKGKRDCRKWSQSWNLIPFDAAAVRSHGLVVAAVIGEGRRPRGRLADLLIAASAHANGLDLYTRNGDDFRGMEHLVRVVQI